MLGTSATVSIPILFYRSAIGNEPVREWLKDLDAADRRLVGQDLQRVQFRWPIGMPLCRSLGAASGRCGRVSTMGA
jgi:hypothetical protein